MFSFKKREYPSNKATASLAGINTVSCQQQLLPGAVISQVPVGSLTESKVCSDTVSSAARFYHFRPPLDPSCCFQGFSLFLQVAQESCDACDASLVAVDFNKTRTPLPAGDTQHTGCVFCDLIFQDLVELKHATMRHGRGGGARRGGLGRGRGRRGNPKKPKDKMAALAAYFVQHLLLVA